MTVRYVFTISLALISTATLARPQFAQVMRSKYKPARGSALVTATCSACHLGDKVRLNSYGKDLQKVMVATGNQKPGNAILIKVEKLDSDKDGVKNIVELKAGSLPGDRHVKPAKRKPVMRMPMKQ